MDVNLMTIRGGTIGRMRNSNGVYDIGVSNSGK